MTRAALSLAAALLAGSLLTSCSAEGETEAVAEGPSCSQGSLLTTIEGIARDESGAPLPGALAQLCVDEPGGGAYCLSPSPARPDGSFSLRTLEGRSCVTWAAVRVSSPDHRRAPLTCPVPRATAAARFAFPIVPPLTQPGVDWIPELSSKQAHDVIFGGGVSQGGMMLVFAPDDLSLEGGASFADLGAVAVPPDPARACFLGEAPRLEGLFAFGPQGELARPAYVLLPNTTKLPPGTPITLYVLGATSCLEAGGRELHQGELGETGVGVVSKDGQWIEATTSSGLRCLTWLGWAAR